jgi:type IV pilus assembly protein PilC
MYFDNLYCNLVEAGEAAGILEQLLDRLAVYMEKTEAIKSKIKSALMYPTAGRGRLRRGDDHHDLRDSSF